MTLQTTGASRVRRVRMGLGGARSGSGQTLRSSGACCWDGVPAGGSAGGKRGLRVSGHPGLVVVAQSGAASARHGGEER